MFEKLMKLIKSKFWIVVKFILTAGCCMTSFLLVLLLLTLIICAPIYAEVIFMATLIISTLACGSILSFIECWKNLNILRNHYKPQPSKCRLQFDFSKKTYARLQRLKKVSNNPTNVATVRSALSFFEWYNSVIKDGGDILADYGEGRVERVIFKKSKKQ